MRVYMYCTHPAELHNVASQQPAVYQQMYEAILELNKTVYSPVRGSDDGAACEAAAGKCEKRPVRSSPLCARLLKLAMG